MLKTVFAFLSLRIFQDSEKEFKGELMFKLRDAVLKIKLHLPTLCRFCSSHFEIFETFSTLKK